MRFARSTRALAFADHRRLLGPLRLCKQGAASCPSYSVVFGWASIVELQGVVQAYGSHEALRGIDLKVATGEVFGIIGRSGAGKSSLVRTINLLNRPKAGKVIVGRRELNALSEPLLRVARREICRRVDELLDLVGLEAGEGVPVRGNPAVHPDGVRGSGGSGF